MISKLRKFLAVSALLAFASPLWAAVPVKVGLSPDNSQELLLSVINGARTSLLINIYDFSSPVISKAVIDKINEGVAVRFLMEGEPTGRMKASQRTESYKVRKAMLAKGNPKNQFSVMWDGKTGTIRRFVFDHAKYVVADGLSVLVSSENFGQSGHTKPGTVGNRGWEIVVQSRPLATQMTTMFAQDSAATNKDIVDFLKRDVPWDVEPSEDSPKPEKARTIPSLPIQPGSADAVRLVVSPQSEDEIVALIRTANRSLEIEFMDLPSTWKQPTERMSPIIEAAIVAARRGVKVRVLMNDVNAFAVTPEEKPGGNRAPAPPRNEITAKLLKTFAKCEDLDIDAKIVDVEKAQISYIHNKGILVDRARAFVSSINGTQNSVENNREVALVVDSADAGAYYGKAFDADWRVSPVFPSADITCN